MVSTLAERIRERMTDLGLTTNADLARRVKLRPPSTYLWLNGTTKNLKGEHLLRTAKLLGVNPDWLATGKPPKLPGDDAQPPMESSVVCQEPLIAEAIEILESLSAEARLEAVAMLRGFAMGKKGERATERADHSLPAGKKKAA